MSFSERFITLLCEHLGMDRADITADSSFVSDLDANSLDMIELIVAMEDEFGVEISDEAAEKLVTVGDALRWLEKNVPTTGAAR